MLAAGVPHCYRFRVPKNQVVKIQVSTGGGVLGCCSGAVGCCCRAQAAAGERRLPPTPALAPATSPPGAPSTPAHRT